MLNPDAKEARLQRARHLEEENAALRKRLIQKCDEMDGVLRHAMKIEAERDKLRGAVARAWEEAARLMCPHCANGVGFETLKGEELHAIYREDGTFVGYSECAAAALREAAPRVHSK